MGHDLYTTATESAIWRHPEAGGPELIVVPTFNEAENVPLVVMRIATRPSPASGGKSSSSMTTADGTAPRRAR
jgi:hypothetical protein